MSKYLLIHKRVEMAEEWAVKAVEKSKVFYYSETYIPTLFF
jgi:hypothetical protein